MPLRRREPADNVRRLWDENELEPLEDWYFVWFTQGLSSLTTGAKQKNSESETIGAGTLRSGSPGACTYTQSTLTSHQLSPWGREASTNVILPWFDVSCSLAGSCVNFCCLSFASLLTSCRVSCKADSSQKVN